MIIYSPSNIHVDKDSASICKKMRELRELLSPSLGCNFLTYSRYYWNKKIFSITDNLEWLHYYCDNELYYYNQQIPNPYYSGCYFLDDYKAYMLGAGDINISPYSALKTLLKSEDDFGHYHQVQILKHHFGYMEVIGLAAPATHHGFNLKVMQEPAIIKKFMTYFNANARELINYGLSKACTITKIRKVVPNLLKPSFIDIKQIKEHSNKQLEEKLEVKRFYLSGPYEDIYLTQREMQSLTLCALDISQRKIALELGVSEPCIREYIDNIKYKLNAYSLKHLKSIVKEHSLLEHAQGHFDFNPHKNAYAHFTEEALQD